MQEAAARHSQRKRKKVLSGGVFWNQCQAVYRIGVDRRADGDARLGISHASLEVATTARSARMRNACLAHKSPLPLQTSLQRLVDTVLRSAQSPEITALVYAAVFIPHHRRDHPEKCHPATHRGWWWQAGRLAGWQLPLHETGDSFPPTLLFPAHHLTAIPFCRLFHASARYRSWV